MSATLFTNVWIFDGSGAPRFPGEVVVEGDHITRVSRTSPGTSAIRCDGAARIDGGGATLMPGLIESHPHLSFPSSRQRIIRERELPPQENLLISAYNARVYLGHGFTSAYSAGSKGPRFEVALKKEIDGGYLPGPRLIPSTFEWPANADKERTGTEALKKFGADMAQDGVKSIKLLLSGDDAFGPGGSQTVEYAEADVAAAAAQAPWQARESDEKLADAMGSAWLAFAQSGDPNVAALPHWPNFRDDRQAMHLGENCRVDPPFNAPALAFFDQQFSALKP